MKKKQRTNGKAVASLILSLTSYALIPFFPALVSIVLGHMARREIREDESASGRALANIGLVLGYLNVVGFLALIAITFALTGTAMIPL